MKELSTGQFGMAGKSHALDVANNDILNLIASTGNCDLWFQ